jgi:endonuclease YncB( thermonuclease family)
MSRLALVSRVGSVVAVAIVAACTACTASKSSPATSQPETTLATIVWVHDGDTIEVEQNGRAFDVRLDGINAPDQDECFYEESTDHLIDTLKDREVGLDVTGEDQFDRVLALVWDGEVSVNQDLVLRGMAIATTPGEDDQSLITAEATAYANGEGLWGGCAVGPAPDVEIESLAFDPAGPDDEVLDAESVVLVNRDSIPVDLEGWVLRDESSRHRYRFDDVTLEPGEGVTVTSAHPGWSPGGSAVWNNEGDMALLLDENGRVVARYRY